MSAAGLLRIGDTVRLDGAAHTVEAFEGAVTVLAPEGGGARVRVPLVTLYRFASIAAGARAPRLAPSHLAEVHQPALEQARWWEQHVVEVETGRTREREQRPPRPEYDPATRSLAQREAAKAAELKAAGHQNVSAATVKRKRLLYNARGLAGLIDWRTDPERVRRVDSRVVAALRQAIAAAVDDSTRDASFLQWKTAQILDAEHGAGRVPVPSRATFYRIFKEMTQGTHTTGSARTRRSIAAQPDRAYGTYTVLRPGQLMEIDSTPLDVAVRLPRGVVGRVELTGMIDVATRTVAAGVLRFKTKSVDASLLLARTLTPELMRPGWVEALRMSRSVLPYRSLLGIDERLEHAAARPVIVPETIVYDQGKVFVSDNFRWSCHSLGIDLQPAHPGTGPDKPHIERMMSSIGTLFAQYLSGYLGSSVERRGYRVEKTQPLWSLPELQEMLDEWIVAAWQNRPHDGLRDPLAPGRMFTPNEKYASLVQAAGYAPIPLGPEDYIELLPAEWRVINHYGVRIGHRVYDDPMLGPMRKQSSRVAAKRGLWEVHRDPYDISRIWVRDHWNGAGWFTVYWKLLRGAPAPFGELAWDHALTRLREHGVADPTQQQIAKAVQDLLTRANAGPPPSAPASSPQVRDQRVAARTEADLRALPIPGWHPPSAADPAVTPAPALAPETVEPGVGHADSSDPVVPLPLFDAHEEARKRW